MENAKGEQFIRNGFEGPGIDRLARDSVLNKSVPFFPLFSQLMGIVPQNAGGFGSIREAAQIYAANELEPIQARMAQVNEWLGEEVVRFKPYEIPTGA